jgi:EAL domain-containing protein (putative c-di-GMP-specific phosphodiesterase class I)
LRSCGDGGDCSFFAAGGLATKLAINVPISIFETPEFVSHLRKYLPRREDFPGLIIELTEDEVIRNPDLAREVARATQSEITGCSNSQQQYRKCKAIVDLARRFGMTVVAEGVESASDVRALRQMNCDMVQGRIFVAPMQRKEFGQWSGRHNMSARAGAITIH